MSYWWFCVRLWFRERPEKLAWWVARHLPRRVALLAFVRVMGEASSISFPTAHPDELTYSQVYKAWEAQR